jgi:DnaJ-domain-containing protein 1
VDTGATPTDALGGAQSVELSRTDEEQMTTIEKHRRIAHCECGAQLTGDSEEELFEAAQRHLAHHHPQLLGALGPEMVTQMAEDVGGIDAYGRPGA